MIDIVVNYHQIPLFNQYFSFDTQLLLSFLVVFTIVYTCQYLVYMLNTPPLSPDKGLQIAHLNINLITGGD